MCSRIYKFWKESNFLNKIEIFSCIMTAIEIAVEVLI